MNSTKRWLRFAETERELWRRVATYRAHARPLQFAAGAAASAVGRVVGAHGRRLLRVCRRRQPERRAIRRRSLARAARSTASVVAAPRNDLVVVIVDGNRS